MKQQLYDRDTGKPAGEIEVPPALATAAALVEHWMRENEVSRFGGLMLFSNRKYTDEG